jgi:tRNA(adenine34) deaminase
MCFGALVHARIARVVFGAPDPKVGVSSLLPALEDARLNHRIAFQGGLLEAECREQVQRFFQRRRK